MPLKGTGVPVSTRAHASTRSAFGVLFTNTRYINSLLFLLLLLLLLWAT